LYIKKYWNHAKFEKFGTQNKHEEAQILFKDILVEAGELNKSTQNNSNPNENNEELKVLL